MLSFEQTVERSGNGRIVRWPLRILGGLLLLASCIVQLGITYLAVIHKEMQAALFAVVALPIVSLVVRLVGYASWKGRVLERPLWPFASGSVAFVWAILFFIVVEYA